MSVVSITPQLRTTDLDRSVRFYTEKVGLQLEFRHADFYASIRAPGGGFHLKLVDSTDPSVGFVREGGHLRRAVACVCRRRDSDVFFASEDPLQRTVVSAD